jgi:(1->4)-alpha-D-glucan 1-alpha-D-glucosylmutase
LRFNHARSLIPYLSELGVTDIYASPLLQARRGSPHGYDVTDPSHLNVELGTGEEFDALVHDLREHDMGLLLDIVPNHMAASSENPWWMDVLEEGPKSPFSPHFDIDWHPPNRSLENRVLLPVLGKPYAQVLENRELVLSYEQAGFFIAYYDFKLPVAARTCNRILKHRLDQLQGSLGPETPILQEFQGIVAGLAQLPGPANGKAEVAGESRQRREALKERLWRLYNTSQEVRQFLDLNVRLFNGKRGSPASFLLLDRLLADQAYVLAFWRTADQEINYRRFFTISELVGIRIEDPLTFEACHSVLLRLAAKGLVTGFRVDHIDGLRDPLGYLRRLQEKFHSDEKNARRNFYVVVEKILSEGEALPSEWPVHGTTGYDFLNALNGLFVDASRLAVLREAYARFTNQRISYPDLVYQKKKQVMETLLPVEMRTLGRYLSVLAKQDRYARELAYEDLTRALIETTACLALYRTYIRGFDIRPSDRRYIHQALQEAQRRNPSLNSACFDFVRQVLLLEPGAHVFPEQREARLAFVMSWQQFTGPITAKGIEDSTLYVYNPLVSLNEVGSSPDSTTGLSVAAFHEIARQRGRRWFASLNPTTTHDTKRAEDTRARINVLSEIPEEWEQRLLAWSNWNESRCCTVEGHRVPHRNEEILLYQTLIGSWPLQSRQLADYIRRIQEFMVKAVREAMVYTRWTIPNAAHERALTDFVAAILERSPYNRFLSDFEQFASRIAFHGALNALSQVLLKIASPGVPDFYQGAELWDLRLVDPDNRQSVDFEQRITSLREINKRPFHELLEHWQDGLVKLYVIARGLQHRKAHPELFLHGNYLPLIVEGDRSDCAVAFARSFGKDWAVVVAPRLTTRLVSAGTPPVGKLVWSDTRIVLPRAAPQKWNDVLTGKEVRSCGMSDVSWLCICSVLAEAPVALLSAQRG